MQEIANRGLPGAQPGPDARGERFEYSNSGYDMLGPLVEEASGTDFATFMRKRVFAPVGMRHSVIS